MKAHLLFKDGDFDLEAALAPGADTLVQDLELDTLFDAMAREDTFLRPVIRAVVLSSLTDRDAILYRQRVLADCLANSAVAREIYDLAVQSLDVEKGHLWGLGRDYPGGVLASSVELMLGYLPLLKRLRQIAERNVARFESDGFRTMFAMLVRELSDDYFAEITEELRTLRFRGGVLISAELGTGNKGVNYTLRKPFKQGMAWLGRIFGDREESFSFSVPPRDEAGEKNLAELRDRGIAPVANALNQSAGHVRSFFHMLRTELAFYVGGVNLHETLTGNTAPVVLPVPAASGERRFAVAALSDVCLCLNLGRRIVGNDIDGDGRDLVVITGANQGGKSTFLRSAGQAQLMMQCGLFVSATAFRADICDGLFTHYRREEDASMQSGKLDEELVRMSAIVDCLRRDSLVLFNESFASTNEREGSEIAGQIVRALLERQVKVFCVTHMFQLAQSFLDRDDTLFLRAERQEGGERSFKLIEGKPLTTSFGKDLYNRIFAVDPGQAGGGGAAARPDVAADRS